MVAVCLLTVVTVELLGDNRLDPTHFIALTVGITLSVLTLVGLIRHWGPVIPCTVLGLIVSSMILDFSMTHSTKERVIRAFGSLLAGTICGTVVGLFLEFHRRNRTSKQDK